MFSANVLLQKQQYTHGLKHDVIIVPNSVILLSIHEFYNSKSHQGTFEAKRKFYWWPKLHQDIEKYINKCDILAKNLPNMVTYPQKHLETPQVSKGNVGYRHDTSSTSYHLKVD